MKKLLSALTILAAAHITFAQTYNINITKKDGSTTTIAAGQIDKIEFLPVSSDTKYADLLDIVFNEDGTATDMSPYRHEVTTIPGNTLSTKYSDVHKKFVANFTHTMGLTATSGFYSIKYTAGGDFINRIADGCTFETIVKLGTPDDQTKEVKWFSSHQAGGIGFILPKYSESTPGSDSFTFLPNISTTGKSTWRWTYSNIVPEVGKYYHIVGIWNKEEGKAYIYVNGKLCGTADAPGEYIPVSSGAESFVIGGDPDTKNQCTNSWNGEVVSARIHDKPMTDQEVAKLWEDIKFDTSATY